MTSCLHTLLRDQTPCSSLSKRFCEFILILILENGFKEKRERPQRLEKEKKKGEVGPIIKENSLSRNYFVFGYLIKKIKEKYNGVLTPRFIEKIVFK